jgi:hypothetical protein
VRKIDVRHLNVYLIVLRLVYHMSSKLKNESIDNLLGKDEEVKLFNTSQGMECTQEPTLIVNFIELTQSTPRYTTSPTSIIVMTGKESFQ